jgi:hypothetical protein
VAQTPGLREEVEEQKKGGPWGRAIWKHDRWRSALAWRTMQIEYVFEHNWMLAKSLILRYLWITKIMSCQSIPHWGRSLKKALGELYSAGSKYRGGGSSSGRICGYRAPHQTPRRQDAVWADSWKSRGPELEDRVPN